MTNGDRIRQMSNEELVKVLSCEFCIYSEETHSPNECIEGKKAYLESEEE